MAKNKKINLEMTPLMMLSIMAFFLSTIVIYQIVNAKTQARVSRTAQPEVIYIVVTPTPEAGDVMMEK